MKKFILSAFVALAALSASAVDADQLRVYINPGHGSWTANDRPMTLVNHPIQHSRYNTDTCSFFESNTNLRKGFGVLEKLRVYGLQFDPTLNQEGERHEIGAARDMDNNIVMSHVKCGPYHDDNPTLGQVGNDSKLLPKDHEYYNRSLSEICVEVESNNFDMFISIHSNAATEGTSTNYPVYLYRGYDNPTNDAGCMIDQQKESKAMAQACWPHGWVNPHMMWTNYGLNNPDIRGDISFYGSSSTSSVTGYKGYLGVLKHGAPGFLVEGYFHTYQCARHKAMNWDVDYMEGAAYAHGIADYFELEKEKTGDIYGIVRDANEKWSDTNYKPNGTTLDRFKPLNGATVKLMKGTEVVATYVTDDFYNGAFVFYDVEPGTYTLDFEAEGYLPTAPVEVEVKAATISYPTAQLTANTYVPPTVTYEQFPDPALEMGGLMPAKEYNFAAEYTDLAIAELEGKQVSRVIAQNGKLYILALDKPIEFAAVIPVEDQAKATIIVFDVEKQKVLANVDLTGAAGSIAAISDIQVTSDGYLLASNATKTQNSDTEIQEGDAGRGTYYIYKWDNDLAGLPTGAPKAWISMQNAGLWYRAYPSKFAYAGTTNEGTAIISMPTVTATSYAQRADIISVMDGQILPATDFRYPEGGNKLIEKGADWTVAISPLNEKQVLQLDSKKGIYAWDIDTPFDGPAVDSNEGLAIDGRAGFFRYAGASYMVSANNDAEGNNNGLVLINLNDKLANAAVTTINGANIPALAAASTAATGEVLCTRNEFTDKVETAWMNLYLVRDGKLTKFTTKEVAQPQSQREFAYDLKLSEDENNYIFEFALTGDAENVDIIINTTPGTPSSYPMGALAKGEHSYSLAKADFDSETSYNWSVAVTSADIAQSGLVREDASGLTVRGGAITMNDPEYDSYGYVVVGHGMNNGVDVYNPAGEKVATRLFKNHELFQKNTTNQSNPMRGAEYRGHAVFASWGDGAHGITAMNPVDLSVDLFSLFTGTKQGSGHFITDDGQNLGGGTPCVAMMDLGDKSYAFTLSEDHEGLNGGGATENSMARYTLEENGWLIKSTPVIMGHKALMANTNCEMQAYGNGVFFSQIRGAGNNAAGCPCFGYIADADSTNGDVVMTSADDGSIDYIDNNTSGIAISHDGKLFAAALTNAIVVFDVDWTEGYPELTYKCSFPIAANGWSNLQFDPAYNIHAYLREGGYRVYSLAGAAPVATTPAAAKYAINAVSGIETLTVGEAGDAAAIYYNLAGMRVAADNLSAGIYVKVKGNTATKVIVK